MATELSSADTLIPGLRALLEHNITQAQEAIIRQAVKDFEVRLRREIASTAMEVSRFYEMHRDRDSITITVKQP